MAPSKTTYTTTITLKHTLMGDKGKETAKELGDNIQIHLDYVAKTLIADMLKLANDKSSWATLTLVP